MTRSSRRRAWRRVRAVLVWLTLPILIWVWVKPVDPAVRVVVSLGYLAFLLFAAPVWCGAANRRDGYCRNNATGLIFGCHLRYHRWEKLQSFMHVRELGRHIGGLSREDVNTAAAVVGALAAALSAFVALVALLIAG